MEKSKYYFLTIKAILFALIIFIFLPSCGNKKATTKKAPDYLAGLETRLHTSRPGHRIAVKTESETESSQNKKESIYIEDVSVQEHRILGDHIIATLKLSVNGKATEIDLFGMIESDGTADLLPLGQNKLVYGVAFCVDKEFCHQIVLDIFYRDTNGVLKRHQVQSITPELQTEVIKDFIDSALTGSENSNNQQDFSSPKGISQEEVPTTETPKQPINVNTPLEIPEGGVEDPLSTIVTRPPRNLEIIQNLLIPTDDIVELQQIETTNIRGQLEAGEDISSLSLEINPPIKPQPPSEENNETNTQNDDFISVIDPDVEIREAMGITPTQFLDNYIDQEGSMQNAIRRQAINRRSSGILMAGELLIRDSHGIKWLQHGDDHLKWVTSVTNHFIRTIGVEFQSEYPEHRVVINRSSKQHGGYLRPHKTHQNGLDLDIAYPHEHASRQRFWNVFDGTGNFIMSKKSGEITMDLLRIMSATGVVNKYHVDQHVKDYLTVLSADRGTLRDDCPILTQLCHAGGHKNHIHVQLKCTQFNQGCHDSADPPYSTCPAPAQCQGL